MRYCGTTMHEKIWMCNCRDYTDQHYIDLVKAESDNVFFVNSCCDEDWYWVFYLNGVSNYEMIKHVIMDVMLESRDMYEVMETLDEVFEENFGEIVAVDDCDCENGCEHCSCK